MVDVITDLHLSFPLVSEVEVAKPIETNICCSMKLISKGETKCQSIEVM